MRSFNAFALCLLFRPYPAEGASESSGSVGRRQSGLALPDCALQCLATSLRTSQCEAADTSCLCLDAAFVQSMAGCVRDHCSVRDALTATRIQATELCPRTIRDKSHVTQVLLWTLFAVAAFAVIARLLSRVSVLGGCGFGSDDWAIFLAFATLTPLNVLCHVMTVHGLGKDSWMLGFDDISRLFYYFWTASFLYNFNLDITKISVLLLYLRMWPGPESRRFRHLCLVLIGLLAVHAVVMTIVLVAGCRPISYSWTRWDGEHHGHCIGLKGQIFAKAGLNIFFDFVVCLLPVPKLVRLSLPSHRKKLVVCLTFTIGLSVAVCGIIRLQYLSVWGVLNNPSWNSTWIVIWSSLECNVGVVCACIPSLAGLAQRLWTTMTGSSFLWHGPEVSVPPRESRRPGDYGLRLRSLSLSRLDTMEEKRSRSLNYDGEVKSPGEVMQDLCMMKDIRASYSSPKRILMPLSNVQGRVTR